MGSFSASEMCRICLSTDAAMNDIFVQKYNEKISSICQVEIQEGDGYPSQICFSCARQLTLVLKFIEEVRQSHEFLSSTFHTTKLQPKNFSPVPEQGQLQEQESDPYHEPYSPKSIVPISENDQVKTQNITIESSGSDESESEPISESKSSPFHCKWCEKSFKYKRHLTAHEKAIHLKEKFTCDLCPKQFSHQANLYTHKASAHGGRRYKCPDCELEFKYPSNLTEHRSVIHEKKKLFKCSVCLKSFAKKSYLKIHEKIHATKDKKPHECSECKRSFTDPSNLKSHLRTHSNVKELKCAYCSAEFTQRPSLSRHYKRCKVKNRET